MGVIYMGKPYGIKPYWEHLGGNLLGTHGNTWGTNGKNEKSLSPYLLKKKKSGPFMSAR
jgi:hypothetical protein